MCGKGKLKLCLIILHFGGISVFLQAIRGWWSSPTLSFMDGVARPLLPSRMIGTQDFRK
jgi:hypothetical protein